MDTEWKIREANQGDSDGLRSCMESAYLTYQIRMGGVRLPPMDVDYSLEIKNCPTWVVESDGCILAGLIMIFENRRASIANIAVSSTAQGKGIGRALMSVAESMAREMDFSEIHLATHVLLTENVSLYQHLGWQETARDETRVYMKKKL